jgi:hypothetical protein
MQGTKTVTPKAHGQSLRSSSKKTGRSGAAAQERLLRPETPDRSSPRFKLKVLRERCKDCVAGETGRIRTCSQAECPLHDYRTGHRPKGRKAKRTPLKALRAYCLWCCCGSYKEVRACRAHACPLWPWRLGRADGEIPPQPSGLDSPAERKNPREEGE